MSKVGAYIRESADELLHKVSWPTWSELQNSAVIVMVASVIFALIIRIMDYTLGINNDTAFFRGLLGIIYDIFNK